VPKPKHSSAAEGLATGVASGGPDRITGAGAGEGKYLAGNAVEFIRGPSEAPTISGGTCRGPQLRSQCARTASIADQFDSSTITLAGQATVSFVSLNFVNMDELYGFRDRAGRRGLRKQESVKRDGACQMTTGQKDRPPPEPGRHRRLFDRILLTFHSACDQEDIEVALELLDVLDFMAQRNQPLRLSAGDCNDNQALVAAHERLWLLLHPGEPR
jgi:hypothetical protein